MFAREGKKVLMPKKKRQNVKSKMPGAFVKHGSFHLQPQLEFVLRQKQVLAPQK